MALLWNSPFASVQGNCFSFRCQSGFLGQITPPPKQGEKLAEAVTLSENTSTEWIMSQALVKIYS